MPTLCANDPLGVRANDPLGVTVREPGVARGGVIEPATPENRAGASVAPVSAIADSRKTANATNRERERLFAIDFIGMGTELPPET